MDTINLDSWGGNSTCPALSKNNGIRRGGAGVEFMSKVRSKGYDYSNWMRRELNVERKSTTQVKQAYFGRYRYT